MRLRWMLLVLCTLVSCAAPFSTSPTSVPSPVVVALPTARITISPAATLVPPATPPPAQTPLLRGYRSRIQETLKQPIPIMILDTGLTPEQARAQDLAIHDARVQQFFHDLQSGDALRVQVFGVYPLRDSDKTQATASCQPTDACYRVELYNFALNAATRVVVNPTANAVLDVQNQGNTQPDIPQSLTDIAIEIARSNPEVKEALEDSTGSQTPVMANTKTALNTTRCERSEHLCVAPTFLYEGRALWAIVDLTDGLLVGTRWTDVGDTGQPATEKSLQDEVVTAGYCDHTTTLERDGWSLEYVLTSSDGLRISNVRYKGTPVLDSVKLVDWHVSYSGTDGFGYSDAVGCPVFSQAAVIATRPPQVTELRENGQVVGFTLIQPFWSELWPRPCNYNYEQQYQFYTDGRFRPAVASFGRGCGNDGTYRPVTRMALAGDLHVREWKDTTWQDWTTEGWRHDFGAAPASDGSSFQLLTRSGGGFAVSLGRGQFGDGGRGDNAYLYVTKHHSDRDEGDSDMMTIGPCCNTDEYQGPEQFIDTPPESTTNTPLVLWYVAQLKNDDTPGKQYCWAESVLGNDGLYHAQTFPCWSGPLLTPVRGSQ